MFDFDPNGQVAIISLDLIRTVNDRYPTADMETTAMAGLMFTIEKAILAKIEPMDFITAVTMAWTFVAGMQRLVELAGKVPPTDDTPPAAQLPEVSIRQVIVPLAQGVH